MSFGGLMTCHSLLKHLSGKARSQEPQSLVARAVDLLQCRNHSCQCAPKDEAGALRRQAVQHCHSETTFLDHRFPPCLIDWDVAVPVGEPVAGFTRAFCSRRVSARDDSGSPVLAAYADDFESLFFTIAYLFLKREINHLPVDKVNLWNLVLSNNFAQLNFFSDQDDVHAINDFLHSFVVLLNSLNNSPDLNAPLLDFFKTRQLEAGARLDAIVRQ